MPVTLTINGVPFQYPITRNEDWGPATTGWATAVTNLLAQVLSASIPLADDGQFRLGNTDQICWRNFGDSDNVCIYVDVDNKLYYKNGGNPPLDISSNAAGNVTGPGSATDEAIARYDGTSGQTLQNSAITISDSGNLDTPADVIIGSTNIELSKALVPIGTIIPHYDFSGAIVPDPVYWVPCDGGTYTIGGVSRVTPDLSNRYLVGFGTEGGGNNDTAPFSTTPVGNASHQVNLQHLHNVNSHTHSISSDGAHTHTIPNHSHSSGTYVASLDVDTATGDVYLNEDAAGAFTATDRLTSISRSASSASRTSGLDITGTSGSANGTTSSNGSHTHTGSTGSATPATDNALSTTQSIQPRSISVRWFMRAK